MSSLFPTCGDVKTLKWCPSLAAVVLAFLVADVEANCGGGTFITSATPRSSGEKPPESVTVNLEFILLGLRRRRRRTPREGCCRCPSCPGGRPMQPWSVLTSLFAEVLTRLSATTGLRASRAPPLPLDESSIADEACLHVLRR